MRFWPKLFGIIAAVGISLIGLFLFLTLVWAPQSVVMASFELERQRNGLATKAVLVDGVEWPYLDGGYADGPTVVTVHGFAADKDNWIRFAGPLTDQYRILAPDLPGFGDASRDPQADYRLPAQLERLRRFLRQLGVTRFHLVGNSMGGHLAALYAHKYPQEVLTLTLIDSAGVTEPTPSPLTEMYAQGKSPFNVETPDDFDSMLAFMSYEPPFIPRPARTLLAERAVKDQSLHRKIHTALMADHAAQLEAKLPQIKTRTLIVWGDSDRGINPSSADVFDQLLPNSEKNVMEKTGHLPMVERPLETAKIFKNFVTGEPQ